MAIKMVDISARPEFPRLCIYGPTGIGKTTLLGTLPGRGFIIDVPQVEGGTFVLADQSKRIKSAKVEEWEDIDEVYWALAKQDEVELPGVKRLNWVAIDSITGMEEMALRKVIRERDRDLGADPHKITRNEYGDTGRLVAELIYRFCKLPYLTVFIAQERTHGGGDDDEGPVQLGPGVRRSVLLALKPPMTIMGRMGITGEGRQEQRVLTVGPPDGPYIVKARAMPGKRLPRRIANPNLGEILDFVFGEGPRPKAARQDLFE